MKLAILGTRGFPSTYGGYETFVRHIARVWTQDGHAVTVYCRTGRPTRFRRTWEVEGVRCIWTPGIDSKAMSTLSFGCSSLLDASFRDFDAALVLNIANGYFLPLLAARNIPTVLNTDGLEWTRGKWGSTAKRVFYKGAELSARYADLLVADSAKIADIWNDEFGVSPRFIPYGADITAEVGGQRIRDLGFTPGSYVLVVARLAPENNVDLTLDALTHLPGVPAIVVGSANYESPIAARLRMLHSSKAVTWLGHVSDQELLSELWANSGVYVHGHSVGGTNPALLQALGAGAPTLALDTPFNQEVLGTDEQLYPASAIELAERIRQLICDSAQRAAFAANGRRVIKERYTWPAVVDAYTEAMRAAIRARADR